MLTFSCYLHSSISIFCCVPLLATKTTCSSINHTVIDICITSPANPMVAKNCENPALICSISSVSCLFQRSRMASILCNCCSCSACTKRKNANNLSCGPFSRAKHAGLLKHAISIFVHRWRYRRSMKMSLNLLFAKLHLPTAKLLF